MHYPASNIAVYKEISINDSALSYSIICLLLLFVIQLFPMNVKTVIITLTVACPSVSAMRVTMVTASSARHWTVSITLMSSVCHPHRGACRSLACGTHI